MQKTNEKKVLVLSFIGALTFIAVVVGATYAYFTAQGGGSKNINVNAITNTTDNLSFQVGEIINITANQENFGAGAGNKSGATFAKATLTANNATNNATRNYYVYLNITSNNFEYTTADSQAELLLKVTNPEGEEVTTLAGLERKISGGVTGFDITTESGLITIADNYEITSTGTVDQNWQIEIVFANLDSDQNVNTGKTFTANLIIQEEKIPTKVTDICENGDNLANCIIELNTIAGDGVDSIYYHDGQGAYINADLEAEDNSYRYAGANPNNYVCFGSDEDVCPVDNLYRIIGIFDGQIKLIKSDFTNNSLLGTNGDYYGVFSNDADSYQGSLATNSIASYYWNNATLTNVWSESNLNTVNLNQNYLNNIGSKWSNLIATTEWIVGGNTTSNIYNVPVKTAYQNEILNPAESTTYSAKVGLMYISDYGYAASPDNWNTNLSNYNTSKNTDNNWLYMGIFEWSISRRSDTSYFSTGISSDGRVSFDYVDSRYNGAVRPTFYLNENVILNGGSGLAVDPYKITI